MTKYSKYCWIYFLALHYLSHSHVSASLHMDLHISWGRRGMITFFAFISLFASMCHHLSLEVCWGCTWMVAFFTFKPFLATMSGFLGLAGVGWIDIAEIFFTLITLNLIFMACFSVPLNSISFYWGILQCAHLNGFSPINIFLFLIKWLEVENDLSHSPHLKDLSHFVFFYELSDVLVE